MLLQQGPVWHTTWSIRTVRLIYRPQKLERVAYRTNVTLYPKWQALLRDRQPRTIIFWCQDDSFFTREGGEANLKDLPKAEMHRLDSGHFAVEDSLDYIVINIRRFYDTKVAK